MQELNAKFEPRLDQVGKAADDARQQLARTTAARDAWISRVDDDYNVISATLSQRKSQYMAGYMEGCSNSKARNEIGKMLESLRAAPDDNKIVGLSARAAGGASARQA